MTGYAVAWLIGRLMKRSQDEIVSLIYTGACAISVPEPFSPFLFPSQVAVPVVIGMLFQQILATLFGYLLRRFELKPVVMKYEKTAQLRERFFPYSQLSRRIELSFECFLMVHGAFFNSERELRLRKAFLLEAFVHVFI